MGVANQQPSVAIAAISVVQALGRAGGVWPVKNRSELRSKIGFMAIGPWTIVKRANSELLNYRVSEGSPREIEDDSRKFNL